MNRRLLTLAALLAAIPAAAQKDAASTDARPASNLKVLEGVEVKLSNRSIFYQRVAPPIPSTVRLPSPTPEVKPLLPAERAAAETRAKKKFEVLMIFATVYDHRVTGLRWWSESIIAAA